MADESLTKRQFVTQVLSIGGKVLLAGLIGTLAVKGARVYVKDPQRYRTHLAPFATAKPTKPKKADVDEGVAMLDANAVHPVSTGGAVHKEAAVTEDDKLRAVKASILARADKLLGTHIVPHLKKPRGQSGKAIVRNLKAQIKKLHPEHQNKALQIGHGILMGGGLGKRGKRVFSTAAKLSALAGTLAALYLGRNHIQSGMQAAWNKVPPATRARGEAMADSVFQKAGVIGDQIQDTAKTAARNLQRGVTRIVRPDATVGDKFMNAVTDTSDHIGDALRTGMKISNIFK